MPDRLRPGGNNGAVVFEQDINSGECNKVSFRPIGADDHGEILDSQLKKQRTSRFDPGVADHQQPG